MTLINAKIFAQFSMVDTKPLSWDKYFFVKISHKIYFGEFYENILGNSRISANCEQILLNNFTGYPTLNFAKFPLNKTFCHFSKKLYFDFRKIM